MQIYYIYFVYPIGKLVVKILLLEKVENAVWIFVIDIISQVESNISIGIQ